MGLKKEIVRFLEKAGIDEVGFADISKYKKVSGGSSPEKIFPKSKIAIVYLYRLEKLYKNYGPWYIASLNNHLSRTNNTLIDFLRSKGLEGVGISESWYNKKTLIGIISCRQLAVLAGLGSIGKNQMLIHPKLGPRTVIGVVLTNAPLKANKPVEKNFCIKCDLCKKVCPTGSFFKKGFDRWRCKNRRKILGEGCGTACVEKCPIGQIKFEKTAERFKIPVSGVYTHR